MENSRALLGRERRAGRSRRAALSASRAAVLEVLSERSEPISIAALAAVTGWRSRTSRSTCSAGWA